MTSGIFNLYFQKVFTQTSRLSVRNTCGDTKLLITATSEGVERMLKKLTAGEAPGPEHLKKRTSPKISWLVARSRHLFFHIY